MTMQTQLKLRVVVHYIAAGEPFKNDDTDPNETVGQLKSQVLIAFGLSEGSTPDGNTAVYTLYHDKTPLENMNQKLGEIAGNQPVLQLKLVQQIVQGA